MNDDVIVPPRSEQQIATQITKKVPRPATFLINKSLTNTEPQLCIGSSLYHITTADNEFPILLNPNDVAVTVNANSVIIRTEEINTPSDDTMPNVAKLNICQEQPKSARKCLAKIASLMGVNNLPKSDQPKAKDLIYRYQNMFALDSSELGLTNLTTFDIHTRDATLVAIPRWQTPYFL